MIEGDRIRNHRQAAEQIDTDESTLQAHTNLALWIIAEQLYEIRRGLEIAREPNSRGEKTA